MLGSLAAERQPPWMVSRFRQPDRSGSAPGGGGMERMLRLMRVLSDVPVRYGRP